MISLARRRPIVAFVALGFAISWLILLPLVLEGAGAISSAPGWLHLLAPLGPALAAVVLTAVLWGRRGLRRLADRGLDPRRLGGVRWWLLAVSPLWFALPLVAVLIVAGADLDWRSLADADEYEARGWVAGLLVTSLSFGIFEEVGWRGFALPVLQARATASAASTALWLIWLAWHLPQFAYHFDLGVAGILAWAGTLYFGTVWLTFLHNSTRGSVLATASWHATYDLVTIGGAIVAPAIPVGVSALLVAATIIAARRTGPENLAHRRRYTEPRPAPG
jgi:membrane protease YdiL (CAAX protease family)